MGFDEVGFPIVDVDDVVAEILGELHLPASLPEFGDGVLHEARPRRFAGQTIDAFRRAAEGVQGVGRDFLQPAASKCRQCPVFGVLATGEADGLAIGQRQEFLLLVGADLRIGIAEDDAGDIKGAAAEARRIGTPAAVAVRAQGFQLQYRLQRGIDQAQAGAGIFGRQRQVGRQFGQGFGHQSGFLGRERWQGEQPADDRRVAGHLQRAGLALGEIDIPGRIDRDDQLGRGVGLEVGALEALRIDLPADGGRPLAAGIERQAQVVGRVQAVGVGHFLQDLGAVSRPETIGAHAALVATVGPNQAQDGEVVFIDELWWRHQRTLDLPPLLGIFRVLALAQLDADLTAVGGPLEDVEQLLAGAGRSCLFLGDGNRCPAQVFDPGEDAAAQPYLRVAFLDGFQQHRRDVLAAAADRAGTAAEQQGLAAGAAGEEDAGAVGAACRAGDGGRDFLLVDADVGDQVDIGAALGEFAFAQPVDDVVFGEGLQGDAGHEALSKGGRRAVRSGAGQ